MAKKPRDPRIGGTTVNEILQDLAIRHGVGIERLKSSEVKKLLDILAEADALALEKLEARLSRLGPVELQQFGYGKYTTERLIKVREALDEIADRAFEVIHGNLASVMLDVGKAEAAFQAGAIAATVTLKTDWVTPSNTLLKTLVRARPFAGKLLREEASEWSRGKRERVVASLRNSIILGEGIPDAAKGVQRILENSRIGAERIARTAIAHITNATRREIYIANADIVRGRKIVTTLDSRRCLICTAQEGKVYPLKSGPQAPFHMSCRCLEVVVLKEGAGFPKGTRASSIGPVPDDISDDEFIRRLSVAEQKQMLGVTKRKLWLKGGLKLDGFVDKSGKEFTLADLARSNAAAFKKAGLDPKGYRSAA